MRRMYKVSCYSNVVELFYSKPQISTSWCRWRKSPRSGGFILRRSIKLEINCFQLCFLIQNMNLCFIRFHLRWGYMWRTVAALRSSHTLSSGCFTSLGSVCWAIFVQSGRPFVNIYKAIWGVLLRTSQRALDTCCFYRKALLRAPPLRSHSCCIP